MAAPDILVPLEMFSFGWLKGPSALLIVVSTPKHYIRHFLFSSNGKLKPALFLFKEIIVQIDKLY